MKFITDKSKVSDTVFPSSRIRTIMKSSLDTGQITNEVLYLMTKSTENFIYHLTKGASAIAKDATKGIKYEHLSELVHKNNNLQFLLQIIPQKIRVKDFKEIVQISTDSSSESDN